ncbi:hypothetical protein BMW23_0232 [Bodo saltans virus]|uniref:Uncharacterized protein n=1 Tax=Bodo saltans virus TaxID=2024608 RepID=A0A2H4UTM3_9VIRU|nr:hypothetical protein QJ851_gp0227 [Bodo saltans virus]ATZ80290.1 hypothetical protein BMW23_0232 [Bodo saltans virus]
MILAIISIFFIFIINPFNPERENMDNNIDNIETHQNFYPIYHNRPTEYDFLFNNYPYWYNKYTPFPWYNPTRFQNLYYYPLVDNYYRYPRIAYY